MGSRNIADAIRVVAVRVIGTLARSIVDTVEVHGTVAIRTLVTVFVVTTFMLVQVADNSTFNVGWPVTHRALRILISAVKMSVPIWT